jgi:Tfp pilus assembly pilus retraction ATPase PilT
LRYAETIPGEGPGAFSLISIRRIKMSEEIRTATVKLSQEEAAGGHVFVDRSILHARVNEKEWGELGDVFIADEEEHVVAWTTPVSMAVRSKRLEVVEEEKVKVKGKDINITDAAQEMADEAKIDVLKIQPTGRGGTQITKGDVKRYIQAQEKD